MGDLCRKVFTDVFHFIHRHRAIRFSILVLLLVHGFFRPGNLTVSPKFSNIVV